MSSVVKLYFFLWKRLINITEKSIENTGMPRFDCYGLRPNRYGHSENAVCSSFVNRGSWVE